MGVTVEQFEKKRGVFRLEEVNFDILELYMEINNRYFERRISYGY